MLKAEQAAGRISGLRCQVPFRLAVGDTLICTFVSDFVYVRNGERIVEDVKGMRTAVYKIKRKLMLALHNIEVLET